MPGQKHLKKLDFFPGLKSWFEMCEIFWVRQSGDEAGYESWDEEQTRVGNPNQTLKKSKTKKLKYSMKF